MTHGSYHNKGGKRPAKNAYVKGGQRYATEPLRCSCREPWHDGEARCIRCGKRLRDKDARRHRLT